jgi:hypothetical protein
VPVADLDGAVEPTDGQTVSTRVERDSHHRHPDVDAVGLPTGVRIP